MSVVPEVELEQQKVSSVNWNQVSSNVFSDNDLQDKDTQSTESLEYARKILFIVMVQLGLACAAALVCYFMTPFKGLLGNPYMLVLSGVAAAGFFFTMWYQPTLRKTAPFNHTLLIAGTVAIAVFAGSFTSQYDSAFFICETMGKFCAITGVYLGARLAKSTTNREYLIRKLMTGALVGFVVCLGLMIFMMSSYPSTRVKRHVTSMIVIQVMISYILTAMYFGYVIVFVIMPGMAEEPTDYIWGVCRVWIHIFIVIWTLLKIAFNWVKSFCM